jgi:hypothetical protein
MRKKTLALSDFSGFLPDYWIYTVNGNGFKFTGGVN